MSPNGRQNIRKITKKIFLNSIVCPKLGWLMRRRQVTEELTLGQQFRIEEGREIGERARTLYPKGVLVNERTFNDALRTTETLIDDQDVNEIYEATFSYGNFVTRADILRRTSDNTWEMKEVKSGINDKPDYIEDMAYTTMVLNNSGINVSQISIMLLSRDYRLGMENPELFVETPHTEEVLDRVEQFEEVMDEIDRLTGNEIAPETELCFSCKKCSLFEDCHGSEVENHIFDIPRLSERKFNALKEENITCIEEIPDRFRLTPYQNVVKTCVQSNAPFISPNLEADLDEIEWPAFFLDFETVKTAIPLYPNIAPHTQILTQYSIHKCSEIGTVEDHLEFLADPTNDCRREIAEKLIDDLEDEGSIVVYTSFEKSMFNKLKELFPDLSNELDAIINRLVDLHKIVRDNFYHQRFHGSTSIKKVLPVLVPEMSYDGLEIAEGDSAMAAFAYMARGRYDETEVNSIRDQLLEYCERDTEAEVKVFEKLVTDYC